MKQPTTIEREKRGADSVQRPCSASCNDLLGRNAELFMDWLISQHFRFSEIRVILTIKRFERLGATFPNQKEIGEFCGMSEPDVSRCLKRLRNRGIVLREINEGFTYRYVVLTPNDKAHLPPNKDL